MPSFPARLALKDAKLVLDAASDADLAGARATMTHLQAAVDAGRGDDDMAVLFAAVRPN
ncbi:hypothetical protein [Amycolatopsis xylanica]|uniref:hypothetical protein n=1 Tax=Amycolatopsis xylanica TaxID=589385 RepID=UPI0015A41A19|nr:hypothetical protein [Amycolatopsis xylanica]